MTTFAVPTLNCYDLLTKCLASAEAGTCRPSQYIVIDNGGDIDEHMRRGTVQLPPGTIVDRPGRNLGVAASWNRAVVLATCDDIILCNDDILLAPTTVAELVRAAEEHPDGVFFQPENIGWSCFLIRRRLVDAIGGFDAGFYPAYFEDNDYHWRMRLAGFDVTVAQGCLVGGHVGSATTQRLRAGGGGACDDRFAGNLERYIKKWGGPPGQEKNKAPSF